jgi:hypothetical protein
MSGDSDQVVQQAIKPYLNANLVLAFVLLTVEPSVNWIFGVKYWSIALKFELAMNEEDISKKNRLVSCVLFGGLAFMTICAGLSCVSTKI